jgi:hypothetical protein
VWDWRRGFTLKYASLVQIGAWTPLLAMVTGLGMWCLGAVLPLHPGIQSGSDS